MATPTTELYTLSLHDALPICSLRRDGRSAPGRVRGPRGHRPARGTRRRGQRGALRRYGEARGAPGRRGRRRSEEHTSELQSRPHLVCRLLLEKKNNNLTHTLT